MLCAQLKEIFHDLLTTVLFVPNSLIVVISQLLPAGNVSPRSYPGVVCGEALNMCLAVGIVVVVDKWISALFALQYCQ